MKFNSKSNLFVNISKNNAFLLGEYIPRSKRDNIACLKFDLKPTTVVLF